MGKRKGMEQMERGVENRIDINDRKDKLQCYHQVEVSQVLSV